MLIVGTGGFAVDLLTDLQAEYAKNELVFFNDTAIPVPEFIRSNFKVIDNYADVKAYFKEVDNRFIVAIGNNYAREKMCSSMLDAGGVNPTFISKQACVGDTAGIAKQGVIIMHATTVPWGTKVGEGTVIYLASRLGHDTHLGKYVFIGAGSIMSRTKVGDYTKLGIHVSFKPGCDLGAHCLVGVGAVVTKSFPDKSIIKGVPAR